MAKKILGLDIRQDAVSAVLVSCGIKGNRIEAHGSAPNSEETGDEGTIRSGTGSALKALAGKMDLSASVCIASFPPDQVIFRNIQVPFKDEKKIRQILPFELESMLPLPSEDIVIDFQPLKLFEHKDHIFLLTASIRRSELKSYLNILADYDINPEIVTVGSWPLAVYLSRLSDIPANWLLVDVERQYASLYLAVTQQICFIRSFAMNMEGSAAGTELCTHIERSLLAFEDTFKRAPGLDCIFITGNSLKGSGIEHEISRAFGVPVKQPDLLRHDGLPIREKPEAAAESEETDNALALTLFDISGLRGFNFRRGPFANRKQWVENKKQLALPGIILAVVLLLTFLNMFIEIRTLEKQVARLDHHIGDVFKAAFPEVTKIVDPIQQMRMKVEEEKKRAVSNGKIEGGFQVIDLLNDISSHVPKEIDAEFTQMVIGPENILLNGNTDTFNSVDSIKRRLEQADAFKQVTISSATTQKSGNRVTFKLKIDM